MSDKQPLPSDWAEQDLAGMYALYTRLCREAHERGEAVAEWLRSERGSDRCSAREPAE